MMKRLLLVLLMLPLMCSAQVAELSLKGGMVFNTLKGTFLGTDNVSQPTNFGGSVALTLGLPANFRVGLSLSAYQVNVKGVSEIEDNNMNVLEYNAPRTYSFGTPLLPLEALLMKRFNIGRIRLDIGAVGGLSLNKTFKADFDNNAYDYTARLTKETWYTYGALLGAQYRLGCRTAIGIEGQVKVLKSPITGAVGMYPLMLKYSVSL